MCGIYGVIGPKADADDVVRAMPSFISHRGPDAYGIQNLPDAILGHQRLSIIDLSSAGAQPMWDVTRRACIVYNGEIYNYLQLREECERRGAQFRSRSDTEVILNLFLLDGWKSFARLNGIFAFCLHDATASEHYLVRDPMGVKPLYYAATPRGLFFGSELKVLLASGAITPEIDDRSLQAYLQLDFVPAPWSIVKSARKLESGWALRVRSGTEPAFLQFSRDESTAASRDERPLAAVAADFGARFTAAVARQMISDAPLGVFLSGGLDSSLVAATAARVAGKRISTFSIAFADPSFDESRYFNEVARTIGSDHHYETVDSERMLDLLPGIASVTSEPLADGSIFPTLVLSRFARQSVKVALSGDGSDELFGGYPTYGLRRTADLASRLPRRVRELLAAGAEALPVSYANFSFDFKVKKFLSGLHRDPIIRNMRWLGSFSAPEVKRLFAPYTDEAQREIETLYRSPAAHASALDALLRTDQRFYMQDQILVKVDRASMATSLEVRVPFLDLEIVDFARRLSDDHKIAKRVPKTFAESLLPSSIIHRKKKGFGVPLGRWFRGPLRQLVGDLLSEHHVRTLGVFDEREVARLRDEHLRGTHDHRKKIFNLISFILWYEEYAADRNRR